MDLKKIVLATAAIIFFAIGCKKEKECDKNDPNSSCYVPPVVNNPTDTIPTGPVDPYAEAKEECAKKSHPDTMYIWNDALKLCEATFTGQHDPYAAAKEECDKKSHPDTMYIWNDVLKICQAIYTGKPQFKIIKLDFGVRSTERPTPEEVAKALADGADSVYLVSLENFDLSSSYSSIHLARDRLNGIMSAVSNNPRVVGKGVINPTVEVAEDVAEYVPARFEAFGFLYIPGYVKQK